jgi:hypothetical protein
MPLAYELEGSPEDPARQCQDHGGRAGKANDPRPERRWRDRAAASAAVATTSATLKTPPTPERRPEPPRKRRDLWTPIHRSRLCRGFPIEHSMPFTVGL